MSVFFVKNGSSVGYQARVGSAGVGQSRFFAVRKYGKRQASALARQAEAAMREAHTAKTGPRDRPNANNSSGLVGIGVRTSGTTGVLFVTVAWREAGRACATSFSTAKLGRVRATELAMRAREVGTGVSYSISARQAWRRLSARLR